MSNRKGLPFKVKMRHDSHFVESLSNRDSEGLGRVISVVDLEPNPKQPRSDLGDLSGLVASIEARGILEPLLVRKVGNGGYQIIAGERRYRAALEAGLTEVPCIEMEITDEETLEIALVENLQRLDLNAFEEADGYLVLNETHGYTHDEISKMVGKSRSWVTESISISRLPEPIRELCRHADITSKTVLLQLVRSSDEEKMRQLIADLTGTGMTRATLRERSQEPELKKGRPKHFKFIYNPKGSNFSLNLAFKKSDVKKSEILKTLRDLLNKIESDEIKL